VWVAVAVCPALASRTHGQATAIEGEARQWHTVTLSFTGPMTGEQATPNPFTDYRLDVTFQHVQSGATMLVPGFYAADGKASDTGAAAGDRWRVHFMPSEPGVWQWTASFRTGAGVAIGPPDAGEPIAFGGATGTIEIAPTDKGRPDFRARGLLQAVGERYLRFAGDGTSFIKTGADSPENFLAYADFDNTDDQGWDDHGLPDGLHRYLPHVDDWVDGDPTWAGGRGKGIIGAVNYLSSEGVNSIYFLTMNAYGDGDDVHPWASYPSDAEPSKSQSVSRFDVSKLEQWDVVFSHMTAKGVLLHVVTQEMENDHFLDDGDLGPQRRLYYRELIARFAHHPALVWNIGEENGNTPEQRAAFAAFFKQTDPYRHPVVVHSLPGEQTSVFNPLLGNANLDGPSLQGAVATAHARAVEWIDSSSNAGRPWFVCQDEVNPAEVGVTPDAGYDGFTGPDNHDALRADVLWGNLMAGGAGAEWYFGYETVQNDLNCEDFRSRDAWWDEGRIARTFFQSQVPFDRMRHADDLLATSGAYALAERDAAGEVTGAVLLYLRNDWSGGTIDLSGPVAGFQARWFNPRDGSLDSSAVAVTGGGPVAVPMPPSSGEDWALLLTPADEGDCDGNGAPDAEEIAADPALDCDGDGALDACQPDCDGNGIADACELADSDCNGNGVPDACDILAGVLTDCDANGVPDACDLANDCNGNGVPDACERSTEGLLGAYYPNEDLAGEARFRIDPALDFDWSRGAPFADFSPDGFSGEWVGTITTPPGEDGRYTFTVAMNDGARLWIDDELLIDEWYDHAEVHSATIDLAGGVAHRIRVQHFEGVQDAMLRLAWQLPSGASETVPAAALSPPAVGCCTGDLNGDGAVDVMDLLAYLDLFFQGDALGERTGDGGVDVFDLLAYLDEWFEGC
jgi:hypothetical protein